VPNCYDIGNEQTYNAKPEYLDGTLQVTWTRNASGQFVATVMANVPITHTWKHAYPNAKIKYTIKLKNFGATIKGKIYLGDTKPQNTNPLWEPPSEGNTQEYNINCSNDNGTIGYKTFTQQLTFRRETTNEVIATSSFNQKVYWTFGTPQIDINEARMNLVANNVFFNLTSPDILDAIKNKLFVKPYFAFGIKNIASSHTGNAEIYFWNRANEGLVDCISHAEFYKRVCKAIGMPADFGKQTLIADYATIDSPNLPKEAKIGDFGWGGTYIHPKLNFPYYKSVPTINPASDATDAAIYQSLLKPKINSLGTSYRGYLGFYLNGQLNNFEAVLIININNKTYYNPGGIRHIYNNKNEAVYKVMDSLEWLFYKVVLAPDINNPIEQHYFQVPTEERLLDYNYRPFH
jgi:hypothetical protein